MRMREPPRPRFPRVGRVAHRLARASPDSPLRRTLTPHAMPAAARGGRDARARPAARATTALRLSARTSPTRFDRRRPRRYARRARQRRHHNASPRATAATGATTGTARTASARTAYGSSARERPASRFVAADRRATVDRWSSSSWRRRAASDPAGLARVSLGPLARSLTAFILSLPQRVVLLLQRALQRTAFAPWPTPCLATAGRSGRTRTCSVAERRGGGHGAIPLLVHAWSGSSRQGLTQRRRERCDPCTHKSSAAQQRANSGQRWTRS
jgi:hypothetical protein